MPVDAAKTFEKFGYYIEDLKSNSSKMVCCVCDLCGKQMERTMQASSKNLSDKTYCQICYNGIFREKTIKRNKKYSVNEDYFAVPNLENSYWAGFIAADGCIAGRKSNVLQIKLSAKDEILLQRFKDNINYTGNVEHIAAKDNVIICGKNSRANPAVNLRITSPKLCDDLAYIFNIHAKKSLIHEPPSGLTEEQELAFIIGYLDGDGWIIRYVNKIPTIGYPQNTCYPIETGMCGTEKFLNWIIEKLKNFSDVKITLKIRKEKNSKIYKLKIPGQFAFDVLTNLSKIEVNKLDRKWNIFEKFVPGIKKSITVRDNMSRGQIKTHCKRGHEFTVETTYTSINKKNGRISRNCAICARVRRKQARINRKKKSDETN